MATPAPASLLSDSLTALGLTADTLFFSLNFDYTPPKPKNEGKKKRFKQNQGALDIDIACVMYDDNCTIKEMVWFKQLRDKVESIRHQGDSLNGKDRGDQAMYHAPLDQEQIRIYLDKIPADIKHIGLIANSYYGQALRRVHAGEIHLSDDEGNHAFDINLKQLPGDCHTLWVASLRREVNDWHLSLQSLPLPAKNLSDAAQEVAHELARSLPVALSVAT